MLRLAMCHQKEKERHTVANLQVNNAPLSFGQDAISKVLTNQYIH